MGEAAHIARRAMSAPRPARPPQPLGTGGSSPGFEIKNPTSVVFLFLFRKKVLKPNVFRPLCPPASCRHGGSDILTARQSSEMQRSLSESLNASRPRRQPERFA